MTDIEIDRPAPTCIALKARSLRSRRAYIPIADLAVRARKSVKGKTLTAERDELITIGFRDVHLDGLIEREPIGDEPYTVVERRGDFEYVTTPVFRRPNGDDFIYHLVKPYLEGPWEITDACTPWWPLPDGREQGFWVLIRLAKAVR